MQGREVAAWVLAALGIGAGVGATIVGWRSTPVPSKQAVTGRGVTVIDGPSPTVAQILARRKEEDERARARALAAEADPLRKPDATAERDAGQTPVFRSREDVVRYLATDSGKQWMGQQGLLPEQIALARVSPLRDAGDGYRALDVSVPGMPFVFILSPPPAAEQAQAPATSATRK